MTKERLCVALRNSVRARMMRPASIHASTHLWTAFVTQARLTFVYVKLALHLGGGSVDATQAQPGCQTVRSRQTVHKFLPSDHRMVLPVPPG